MATSKTFTPPHSFMPLRKSKSNSNISDKTSPDQDTRLEDSGPDVEQVDGFHHVQDDPAHPPLQEHEKTTTTTATALIANHISNHHLKPSPHHPRANLTTQDIIDLCLSNHNASRSSKSSSSSLNSSHGLTTLSSTSNLLFLNPDSPSQQRRRRDVRSPIPPSERNFHSISRDPPEFSFEIEGRECEVSKDGLTEGNMVKRWMGDYVDWGQRVEEWRVELEIPENVQVEEEGEGKVLRGIGKARTKVVGVGRVFGKRVRGRMEGNALV